MVIWLFIDIIVIAIHFSFGFHEWKPCLWRDDFAVNRLEVVVLVTGMVQYNRRGSLVVEDSSSGLGPVVEVVCELEYVLYLFICWKLLLKFV